MRSTLLKKITKNILPPLLTILMCAVITLTALDHYFHSSGSKELAAAVKNFYKPHENIFFAPSLAGINFYIFIYAVLLLSLIFLAFINSIRTRRKKSNPPESIFSLLPILLVIMFSLVTITQTIGQAYYAKREFVLFTDKTMEEKYAVVTGPRIHSFVRYCRKILPGFHNANFLTGMDRSKDPGMISHRMLTYFLYPIDVRGVRGGRTDSLIVFYKEDAVASIPDDFRILGTFDQYSVVAIRKDTP